MTRMGEGSDIAGIRESRCEALDSDVFAFGMKVVGVAGDRDDGVDEEDCAELMLRICEKMRCLLQRRG